jgi:hypothetical protein
MAQRRSFWLTSALATVACGTVLASASMADAKVLELYKISNYQPTQGGVQLSNIASVTGQFTTGNTAVDDDANITVVENVGGTHYTYNYTGIGPYQDQSQFSSDPFFKASFVINQAYGGNGVYNNIPVSLQDFVYGGTGTVTITATQFPLGVPEPSLWALMITGLATLGGTLRMTRRKPILARLS